MSASDLEMLMQNTGICVLVMGVLFGISWPLAGAWISFKNVSPPTRREAVRDLSLCFILSVLCFAIVPSIIESYGHTYPISGGTLGYFLIVGGALLLIVWHQLLACKTQPSQRSAFIVIMGCATVGLVMLLLWAFFVAIAGSALT